MGILQTSFTHFIQVHQSFEILTNYAFNALCLHKTEVPLLFTPKKQSQAIDGQLDEMGNSQKGRCDTSVANILFSPCIMCKKIIVG